jgi:hypothetical protein
MPISLTNTNGTGGITFRNNSNSGGIIAASNNFRFLGIYSGVSMALSLRKVIPSYNGSAIRVQRSSDSAQQDIGFVGTELDTGSLTSFVGVGTGTVVTWYDQSGNGYNVSVFSPAGTADIIVSGVLKTLNGKPALYFDGTKVYIGGVATPNIYSATKQSISFGVGNALDTSTRLMLLFGGGAFNAQVIRRSGNTLEMIAYQSTGTPTDIGNTNVSTSQFIACAERGNTAIEMWTNNSSNGSTNLTGTVNGLNPVPVIGGFNASSQRWYGHMQEIIVFALNPSTNTTYRNDITTALNSYYTTY